MINIIGHSLGRYQILEQLGQGGMATVYKAYDTRLERDVAVKVLRTELFGQAILERLQKRFEREAKALAKLSHPNIVEVYDYGEYEGQPYLVMKYLPGGTLKQRVGKPMPWGEALRLLLPVVRALDYAHMHNILHRDVKPSNILLTENGQPMLTDFGIAKILDLEDGQTLTATGVGVGTPEYMSPEQGLGKPVDARTDIYSLGVVLYELVTGRKPFQADTPMAVVVKHLNAPLPRPTQFVPDLPEGVEKILLKALAKQPADRYQSMTEMAAAMEQLVSSEQLSAGSRSSLSRGKRTAWRETDAAATTDQAADEAATVDQSVTGETAVQERERRPQTAIRQLSSETRRLPSKIWFSLGLLMLLLGAGAVLGLSPFLGVRGLGLLAGLATPTFTPTRTPTRTPTPTFTPARTPTRTPTPTLWARATATTDIVVWANKDWQDSGLYVQQGEIVEIVYLAGKWSPWSGHFVDGGGNPGSTNGSNVIKGVPHASLIGRIGNGTPFFIGNKLTFPAIESSGVLWLRINDIVTGDNSGSITVRVTFQQK